MSVPFSFVRISIPTGVLLALLPCLALAWTPANTTARSADGAVSVEGLTGSARHTHGGEAARLGYARFRVTSTAEEPRPLTVTKVVFLRGHDCERAPTEVVSTPAFGGIFPDDGSLDHSVRTWPVPPGTSTEIHVGFEAVQAYYTWCDRFVFRVHFDASGEALVASAETNVTRVEPLRE